MAATSIDLTPFGFTTTESRAYLRLVRGGPASGYAVARDLVIARANAYQALRGLVAKGAAIVMGESPRRFRAVRQADLFAAIVERQTRQLSDLENQIATELDSGADTFVAINGERGFLDLAMRGLARERGAMQCIAPTQVIATLAPVLRKRALDGVETVLRTLGDEGAAGSVSSDQAKRFFGSDVAMLLGDSWVLVGKMDSRQFLGGFWTTDPALLGTARAAWAALTSEAS